MIFLANENIPLDSIAFLRSKNCEVISIKEITPGISDLTVLELAKTHSAIILTFDKDYGEIVYRNEFQNSPAIVFFRFKGYDSLFAGNTLIKLIEDSTISIENCFTVVEEETIRQRKL